ncbi:MAG: 30S ribosomal protein S19 [Candidatus Colwellbacteria bacterium]|nr:30S ribosomal protein S19 [Candidatus Colwellbacteria bacterium]MBI3273987.1 30S ribosomal protein S19 [Candidatus Colwellbacteria bacterium]
MSRSSKKGPYVDAKLLKKVSRVQGGGLSAGGAGKTVIKTWSRSSAVSPEMVGLTFGVHNGKDFISVFVTEDMVGHKLGEFSPTRKFIKHGGKIQKGLEQAAAANAATAASKTAPVTKK